MCSPCRLRAICRSSWLAIGLAAVSFLVACDREEAPAPVAKPSEPIPDVVTTDIEAGIKKHIAEQVRQGGGYFRLPFKDHELALKLVRVHVEYLATLGPRSHFACVDMVGTDGEFYDVDFFLAGDPGAMTVTETMVHKINGKPLYLWKQKPDKTWGRVPVDEASKQLLGVLTGKYAFEFRYQATLPQITGPAKVWVPLADSDQFQKVDVKSMRIPGKQTILTDAAHGNRVLHLELGPEHSGRMLEILYDVERLEKAAYEGDPADAARYLEPERLVPADDKFRVTAEKAIEGKEGDLMRARALYDHVVDSMAYKKCGEGWGQGDAVYACNALSGNCTDYHSYFVALARSVGIPARFAIGAAIPSERDEGGVDGYHCWAEFWAEGKWWPVDISEGDKFSALSMYYFGHHPANRVEFSRGRDLVVEPEPASGPINFLAYPVLEVNGESQKALIRFSFKRAKGSAA
jgi:hypothetical protein